MSVICNHDGFISSSTYINTYVLKVLSDRGELVHSLLVQYFHQLPKKKRIQPKHNKTFSWRKPTLCGRELSRKEEGHSEPMLAKTVGIYLYILVGDSCWKEWAWGKANSSERRAYPSAKGKSVINTASFLASRSKPSHIACISSLVNTFMRSDDKFWISSSRWVN